MQIFPSLHAVARDLSKGLIRTRNYFPPPLCAGWEYLPKTNFLENARRIREEVLEHGFFCGFGLTHYYLDSRIWRVRSGPSLRTTLQLA